MTTFSSNSSFSSLTPDDPRLTAFALGELDDPAERAAIAAAVAADPVLQAAVDDIRRVASELETCFAAEPEPLSAPDDVAPADASSPPSVSTTERSFWARGWQFYGPVAGLMAAGFALVIVGLDRPPQRSVDGESIVVANEAPNAAPETAEASAAPKEEVRRIELDLVGSSTVAVDVAAPELPTFADAAKLDSFAGTPNGAGLREEVLQNLPSPFPVPVPAPVSAPLSAPVPVAASVQPQAGVTLSTYAYQEARPATAMRTDFAAGVSATSPQLFKGSMFAVSEQAAPVFSPPPDWHAPADAESYAAAKENPFQTVAAHPLSTFAVDVDTASYANVRRFLESGQRPPRDAVRIEELINYFPYDYAPPAAAPASAGEPAEVAPFAAHLEVASAPWAPEHRLVRIGLKGRVFTADDVRPAANLVFLLDVSGSMRAANKLPLVQRAMKLLLAQLRPEDRVAIVTYAGSSGLALPSTPASERAAIIRAIDELRSGGSTNGAMGIQLAYDIAKANAVDGGINRVILCTDGDFNVGVTNRGDLVRLIAEKARTGTFLTVLGFGMGNLKDDTLEQLADRGNGAYGYVDSEKEARKLLVEQIDGTLATIAKDVKVQIEFNPAKVASYRLIGYENRLLKKEDFNNDAVDAGDIGAGHTVTALYEIVPAGGAIPGAPGAVDPLKYQPALDNAARAAATQLAAATEELLTVKLRYKQPEADVSRRLEFPLVDGGAAFEAASADFKFASAVAAFGMVLRDAPHRGDATLDRVAGWAEDGLGDEADGYRQEFLTLVQAARRLTATPQS